MRMTPEDVAAFKAMFADNKGGLKALRKIFLPELSTDNPLNMNFDLWSKLDLSGLSGEQKLVKVEANQMLIAHIEACLGMINVLAGSKDETAEETLERLMKDSTK